jgi:ATP-dependent Zn protease
MIALIEKSTQRTRDIINKHKDKIEGLAEAVLAKETLNHR